MDAGPIVLVGMMGAGKTTVAKLVAERTRREFLDSDAQIVAATGRSVAEIWRAEGEPAFRQLESSVLQAALLKRDVVIAAAGGSVMDPVNRRAMQVATVVWLRARPETLVARARSGNHRPLLDENPLEVLTTLHESREHLYAEVADVVIDVDELDPVVVADRILEKLQ